MIINWNNFKSKFDAREEKAFEDLSYLLFCAEFNNGIGVFRYKNQTGIETEPIIREGTTYGFQAKYNATPISENKNDIIGSIRNAKRKNSNLDKLVLYTYQEFAESSLPDKKEPTYKIAIEDVAQQLNLKIDWRVRSQIEAQLVRPENKYIHDMFFKLDANLGDLVDDIREHNENILRTIQTSITCNEHQIKIDRKEVISQIKLAIDSAQDIIISGDGGCGKTAILKEFYFENNLRYPICIFKASELNVRNVNDIFRLNNNFSLKQFLEAYKPETTKIFVVDSAERLAEINNTDVLQNLIQSLKNDHWTIFFTTRYSYLNDLRFHIEQTYRLPYRTIDIPLLSVETLNNFSKAYNFILPQNQKLVDMLRNVFYLNEYVQECSSIDTKTNINGFVDLIWKKRIQKVSYQKNNMHIEREKCFIYIAKKRCDASLFYIDSADLSQQALFMLKQDDVLGFDENHNGYFITHDIYEEWALEKIISQCYANYVDSKSFFDKLGTSLPIRRAFRLWLSEQLCNNTDSIIEFISDTFTNSNVLSCWKDELIVSILLSDYAATFFTLFKKDLIANEFNMLNRILFLLRIACKEEDNSLQKVLKDDAMDYILTKPKGKGWEVAIAFIYEHRQDYFETHLKLTLPILTDWVSANKEGDATRFAGLLALSLIEKPTNATRVYLGQDIEKDVLNIICNSAKELTSILQQIFNSVAANKWLYPGDPYNGLCRMILEESYCAVNIINTLPLSVIQLCGLFWQRVNWGDKRGFNEIDMESDYGIASEYHFSYFPPGALQTPIYWLLQVKFEETLDFIIDVVNQSMQHYQLLNHGRATIKRVILHIGDTDIEQYVCSEFWTIYRGISGPYLLQSVHMALEKYLLDYARLARSEIIEPFLLQILIKSKSASLTAIVCSVVLANPYKFHNIALILFKTIELFDMDWIRNFREHEVKSLYAIGYGLNNIENMLYTTERLNTCNDKHRDSHLEFLFLKYQFCGVNGFTEKQNIKFINKLYNIIDQHKKNILTKDGLDTNQLKILLARMDRRNLSPKLTTQDNSSNIIELVPMVLPDELKKQSEQAAKQAGDVFKYSSLKIWANVIHNTERFDTQRQEKYDSDPQQALTETKQLVEELSLGHRPLDNSIPSFACSKLMIEYRGKLSREDKDFCKEVILSFVSQIFSYNHRGQINDGVEASVRAIPYLMLEYPNDKNNLILTMAFMLLDNTSLGHYYKRTCDYIIESIHGVTLWELSHNDAQAILLCFIKLKLMHKNISNEMLKKKSSYEYVSEASILQKLGDKMAKFSFNDISFDIHDILSFDIKDLETVYQLIPSNTIDSIHLEIYEKTLPFIASRLLIDRYFYREKFGDDSSIYRSRAYIFKSVAYFLLEREITEIDTYLQPFINSFEATEEASSFLDNIISAEDYKNKYKQFWHIWDKLYPKVVEVCKDSRRLDSGRIVNSYLLAWQQWREDVTEWHSLKKEDLVFYANIVNDLGNHPNVLFSIANVMNSIGSNFLNDGINLVHTIMSKNKGLKLKGLEYDTLYYLEKLMRKYIFLNKEKIKLEAKLNSKVILILEFMIERGSVHGYLLRESVL